MAKIPLRAYTKEIDGLIDRGQYEQALAHCRHILKFIPKHIDTYRLMAKAYLESQRYGDASDVFQRVLSSIPDDFVSQLGMSIIREDEGNLDAAIWHMERAFEIQPSNGAIQSELRRLYGRRDGIEPPKIRLTRGALARMYFKGELYPQAISELRAALAADPQRPDLQLLLAKSYAQSGHKVEAVTACTSVLKKLPYCIEANRIQAEILENTDRSEDAQAYRQRAIAMNPYLGQINPKAQTPEQVPDEAVVLERLDYMPDKGVSSQPRWAASLGVDLSSQPASQEDIPDWLQELEKSPASAVTETSEVITKVSPFVTEEEQSKTDEQVIPEWMKEAGWEPSNGDTSLAEMGYSFDDEADDEEDDGLAPAEIPSWLRGMAPEDADSSDRLSGIGSEEIDQKLIDALDSAALPWLDETPPGAGDTITGWLGGEGPQGEMADEGESAEGLPDWLVGAAAGGIGAALGAAASRDKDHEADELFQASEEPVSAEFGEEFSSELETESPLDAPDWMSELEEAGELEPEAGGISPAEKSEIPEWLVGAAAASAAGALGSDVAEPEQTEVPPDALAEEMPGELPDWMIETPDEGSAVASLGELPDWLEEAPADEAPEAEPAATPEWMDAAETRGTGDEQAAETDAGLPEWLIGAAAGAAVGAAALASSGDDETQEPAELAQEEEPEISAISDQPLEISSTIEGIPEEAARDAQDVVTPEEEEAAFAWLEGLAAKQGISEALLLSPEERLDEMPEWIQEEAAFDSEPLILEEEVQEQPISDGEQVLDELLPPELGEMEAGLVEPGELVDISPLEDVPTDTSPEEFLPDWLRAAGPESEVVQAEGELETEGEIPAWLSQMDQPSELSSEEYDFTTEKPFSEEDMLDWLPGVSEGADLEGALALQDDEEILSDWLSRTPAEELAAEDDLVQSHASYQETGPAAELEIDIESEAREIQLTETEAADEIVQSPPDEEGVPAWAVAAAAAALAMDRDAVPEDAAELSEETEQPSGIPEWLEEPEPGAESTPVGLTAERLEIEEPEIVASDTQPSSAVDTGTEQAEPAAVEDGKPEEITAEDEIGSKAMAEAGQAISDEDAAFAWLESLAVKQGATEALLLSPEDRLEEPPEWILEETLSVQSESPDQTYVPEAEQVATAIEAGEETAAESVTGEEELPEWLIGAGAAAAAGAAALLAGEGEEPAAEATHEEEPETPEMLPPDLEAEVDELLPAEDLPDLPDWLADLEPEPGEPADVYDWEAVEGIEWMPEMADVESISEAIEQEMKISPLDINTASLIEIERLPGVGFRRAQALVEYRQQYGPLDTIEQLSEVEGFDSEMIAELSPYLQVTGPEISGVEDDDKVEVDLLIQARAAIYKADIDTALQNYQTLIQEKHNLPEIVKDLEEALYDHPVDASLWMTLGDAQMRAGQLHKAFEAYNKAEELLV